ncbi:palmitoyltransferase swf1 [Gracilaria domingensis]|nr:palmitoyltransferase swf1 [Gracilaria domingensis]
MVAHGALLCAEIVRARMQELIRKRYIYVPTNEVIKSFSFRHAIAADTAVCLFLAVLVLLFIMIGSFLVYHLYLIACNTTTNETDKWSAVRAAVRRYAQAHGRSMAEAMKEEARQDYLDGNENALDELPKFGEDGFPVNAYDNELWANAWEVFFPDSYLRYQTRNARKSANSDTTGKTD